MLMIHSESLEFTHHLVEHLPHSCGHRFRSLCFSHYYWRLSQYSP